MKQDLKPFAEKFLKIFSSSLDWLTLAYLERGIYVYINLNDVFVYMPEVLQTPVSREKMQKKISGMPER